MKNTLIGLCAAIALVGCSQNRGGMGDNNDRDTGSSSSRDTTSPSTRNDSSIILTNTNSVTTPPAEPEAKSSTDNYNNSAPKN